MIIDNKLREIISSVADLNQQETLAISDNTILTNDLGFDSVQIVELIVELESQFNIEIEDHDLDVEKLTIYINLRMMLEEKIEKGINNG